MVIFASDVAKPEGPVVLSDGSWAITEMDRGSISLFSADGTTRRTLVETGRPNGIALDADGNFWVAESMHPALLRITPAGGVTTITVGSPDSPFLWPNDLCFGPDGHIYMTDSGILLGSFKGVNPAETAYDPPIDGRLYRIDPWSGSCAVMDRGLQFANGIAWGPDGTELFVSETLTGNIYRYRPEDVCLSGGRDLFTNVMDQPAESFGRVAGPDGMAFDVDGRLYVGVVSQGSIAVVEPDGTIGGSLDIPEDFPTNVAFAGSQEPRMLVTEGSLGQLLMLDTPAPGLPLIGAHTNRATT